jgi:hypothetical protein
MNEDEENMGMPNTGLDIELLGSKLVGPDELDVGAVISEEAQRLAHSIKSPIITTTDSYSIMNFGKGSLTLSGLTQRDGDSSKISIELRVTYEGKPLSDAHYAELLGQIRNIDYTAAEKRVIIPADALLNAI